MTQDKPIILYPTGQGGQWLSNLIFNLNTRNFAIAPVALNFHGVDKTPLVDVRHWPGPEGGTMDPHNCEVFCSARTQFVAFVNAYVKQWMADNPWFTQLTAIQQFFHLSNDARWRMGCDPVFNNLYLDRVTLDADLMFVDDQLFATKLFELLTRHGIDHDPDRDFVRQALINWFKTCRIQEHFGNSQSMAWLSWCHALTQEHNMSLDINIAENFDLFVDFVNLNNHVFKDITQQNFIIKVPHENNN